VSRDAKVGLVIVFTFVFLLGTILIHRLETTMADGSDADPHGVAVDEGVGPSATEGDMVGETGVAEATATTVDAGAHEPLPTRTVGRSGGAPTNAGFPTASNSIVQSSGTRTADATAQEVAPDSRGADIVFAEPGGDSQGDIVVEPPKRTEPNLLRGTPRDNAATTAAMEPDSTTAGGRPSPLLEVNGGRETARTSRNVATFSPNQDDMRTEQDASQGSDAVAAAQAEPMTSADEPAEMVGDPDLGPTAGEPADDPLDAAPNSLPRSVGSVRSEPREMPQPIIESVDEKDPSTLGPGVKHGAGVLGTARPKNTREPAPDVLAPHRIPRGAARQDRTYVVKSGDSYWSISAKSYGSGKHFRALEQYNLDRADSPAQAGKPLRPGDVVLIPDIEVLRTARTEPTDVSDQPGPRPAPAATDVEPEPAATPETYRVLDGDSLVSISKRVFGTSKRWEEIYWLNQDRLPDPHQLKVGMVLRLPTDQPVEKVANRPSIRR
jgi:nucleoid-associated protein YgaU